MAPKSTRGSDAEEKIKKKNKVTDLGQQVKTKRTAPVPGLDLVVPRGAADEKKKIQTHDARGEEIEIKKKNKKREEDVSLGGLHPSLLSGNQCQVTLSVNLLTP